MLRLIRWRSTRARIVILIALGILFEDLLHQYAYHIPRPSQHGDPPFQTGCQEPKIDAPRANATILMLAQNSDLEEAVSALASLEQHFNRWYHYPVVFLNNEPWDEEFKKRLSETVSGKAEFELIPKEMFSPPRSMSEEVLRGYLANQRDSGVHKGGLESYHDMCRFYSGMFYDVPALQKYKWYWRVEPHVDFSCAVTYDPFIEMEKRGKKYGYTIALWELGSTVQTLYRAISDFKKEKNIPTSKLWTSMIRPSWVIWPFRKWYSSQPLHDTSGDMWNLCHFWSNFEIADMDFFRSQLHRELFEYLERKGGFYAERWGDASVHSLAVAMLLKPEELHHFAEFGYAHYPWRVSPANAKSGQLSGSSTLGPLPRKLGVEKEDGLGCRCEHKEGRNFQNQCLNKLQRATHPIPWENKIGW